MAASKRAPKQKREPKKKPLSLWPLTVEEAAEVILKVPPMPKEKKGLDGTGPVESGRAPESDIDEVDGNG